MSNRTKNPLDFIRTLSRVMLPSTSKERMRADLSAYADLHALSAPIPGVESPSVFSLLVARTRGLYAGAIALVLVISAGTQAGFAAEGAVPGDVLYPVKVAMAEPIALTLAVSPERKAELSARYASRRVDEAASLSQEGKLDEKTADELATRFDTHVDALAKETDALEASGDIAVSLAVRTDLEQKVSAQVEGFAAASAAAAPSPNPAGDVMLAKMAVAEAPSDRFSAHVYEKSRTLATTRERLDSALALDAKAEVGASTDLALLRTDPVTVASGETPSAVLFFAKAAGDTVSATLLASSTATTTATSSEPEAATTSAPAAARFFAPFIKR